jgi:outer membrane protein OmpA-like peptidoglycan-associated protein
MMHILIFLIFLVPTVLFSNVDFSGNWRGMIIHSHQTAETADVIYIKIQSDEENRFTGYSRVEILNEKEYAIKQFKASQEENEIVMEDVHLKSFSRSRNAPKCKLKCTLTYNEETEYLKGTFQSTDCRRVKGEIILYRIDKPFNLEEEPALSHYWKYNFVRNYNKGFPSPDVLARKQKNFKLHPIYFDHDRSEVKAEFHDYLNEMIEILEGIHDLRVKVIGHTDAVGTDQYNIGLSERRAKAIQDFFTSRGVSEDKLEIDFKGKREPIDTNKTSEGKQRNRRVDFEFI